MHVTKHKAGYDCVQINISKIAMLNNKAPLDILMLYETQAGNESQLFNRFTLFPVQGGMTKAF